MEISMRLIKYRISSLVKWKIIVWNCVYRDTIFVIEVISDLTDARVWFESRNEIL